MKTKTNGKTNGKPAAKVPPGHGSANQPSPSAIRLRELAVNRLIVTDTAGHTRFKVEGGLEDGFTQLEMYAPCGKPIIHLVCTHDGRALVMVGYDAEVVVEAFPNGKVRTRGI